MTKKDFEDFQDFNKFDSSDDIVSPYEFDKPARAGASRAKAIAVASAGFVVLGALVGGGAFAMTGNSSSTPAVSLVDPSVAPTDSTAIAPTESDDASDIDSSAAMEVPATTDAPAATDTPAVTDTPVATDTPAPIDPSAPAVTPTAPSFSSDDEGDDQSDD